MHNSYKNDKSADEDNDDRYNSNTNTTLKCEASDMIFKLKQYAKQIGSFKVFDFISKAEDELKFFFQALQANCDTRLFTGTNLNLIFLTVQYYIIILNELSF